MKPGPKPKLKKDKKRKRDKPKEVMVTKANKGNVRATEARRQSHDGATEARIAAINSTLFSLTYEDGEEPPVPEMVTKVELHGNRTVIREWVKGQERLHYPSEPWHSGWLPKLLPPGPKEFMWLYDVLKPETIKVLWSSRAYMALAYEAANNVYLSGDIQGGIAHHKWHTRDFIERYQQHERSRLDAKRRGE